MTTPAEALARLALQTLDARREADAYRGDLDRKRHADALAKKLREAAEAVLRPRQAQPLMFGEE